MIRAYSSWKYKIQYFKILEYLYLNFNKLPSLQYTFRVSLVIWNHNNGKYCWLGSGPEDDHWHLPQRGQVTEVITERCGCSRSAVSKHIKCKVDWKEEIGSEKVHKQQEWHQAWEYCQAKLIQTLGRSSQWVNWSWSQCIKSHHAQTSSGKGLPSHFWNKTLSEALTWAKEKKTGLLLSGPKSSFREINFIYLKSSSRVWGRVERHRIHVAWSPVWSFHSQWWFELPCHLLVLVHCVQRSHLPGSFRALLASFCDKIYGDADLFSSRTLHLPTLPKVPKAGSMTMVLLCLIGQ